MTSALTNQTETLNRTLNVLIEKQNPDLCWRTFHRANLKQTKNVIRLAIVWLDWWSYMDDPFLGKVVK
jgi:hypothetical protein